MTVVKILMTAAAATMAVAPAIAAQTNPAASLSVAKSVRAAAPAKKGQKLAGSGFIVAAIAVVAVIAGVIIVADDNDSN